MWRSLIIFDIGKWQILEELYWKEIILKPLMKKHCRILVGKIRFILTEKFNLSAIFLNFSNNFSDNTHIWFSIETGNLWPVYQTAINSSDQRIVPPDLVESHGSESLSRFNLFHSPIFVGDYCYKTMREHRKHTVLSRLVSLFV